MSQAKQKSKKPLLNRKQTETLLKALKATTVAGTLSLTMAGWSALAQADARNVSQSAADRQTAVVASQGTLAKSADRNHASPQNQVVTLNVVGWVQDISGNRVAVVRDSRGTLWYVMGSDIPRIQQGLSPQYQPQPVQQVTRTRAS